MPQWVLLLWFLCFFHNVSFGQVAGRTVSGVTVPTNYPSVDLSSESKAHANLAIDPKEADRATRNDSNKRPPLYNEKDPMRSGEISYQTYIQYGIGYEPLHLRNADFVVVGTVSGAASHLSKSGTTVYSTFTFVPESLLKGSLSLKDSLTLERKGGYVVFPSGKKRYIGISGQGLPVPGYRYLLSLKSTPLHDDYEILGGYALLGSHVICLDKPIDNDLDTVSDEVLISKVKQKISAQ